VTQLEERWGTDLRLLGNLDSQNDRDRAHDLFILETPLQSGGEVEAVLPVDLETLQGLNNLKQALLLRFLTPVGEMTALGHPDYGCRLYELIGQLNNDTNRNRAKMFVLQALAAEPRVKSVLSVEVKQNPTEPTQMDMAITLIPLDSDTILNLVFPFFLERGIRT